MAKMPNISKSLAPAPRGEDVPEGLGLVVELEAPENETEVVELDDGGVEITFGPKETAKPGGFDENLAETLADGVLSDLSVELREGIDDDKRAREDWERVYKEGLKLLGFKYEERSQPWKGASGVTHPMITEAVVRFQSETVMETFPAAGPALTKVLGKETREKMEAALRVRADMNYQLTEVMPEFRDEHERMLFSLPAVGCAFKKVYTDDSLGRQTSLFIGAEDLLLPYGSTNVRTAERVTHIIRKSRNELLKLMESGFYKTVELNEAGMRELDEIKQAKDKEVGFDDINDDRFTLYESHVNIVVGGDTRRGKRKEGIGLPYVITMLHETDEIISVRRNWKEKDKRQRKQQHFVQYDYIPGFGPYGFGLFHLIGGYAKSATSLLRQLVDAGTLSNLPGGLKTRGLRIKGDDTPIGPGEFRDVDVGAGTIQNNIMMLPYKEPSMVLSGLLDKIVEEGRRLPGMADMKIDTMSAQAPVGTTLALIERQLKVMSAVQARVHNSLKEEFKLLKTLISEENSDEDYDYEPTSGTRASRASDYALVEVIPVSDPSASTLTQRLVQYQAVIQLSQTAPQIYNLPLLHRGMLEVMGIKNAEKLVPLPEDAKPTDPVTENMNVLKGTPVKAFLTQNHEAHIAVHQAAMQDPILMQTIGQNPQAQMLMAAAQAHISEHVGLLYRQKMQAQMGIQLPDPDAPMSPEDEIALSMQMVPAAQQLLEQNKQMAAQQAAQQAAQDPVVQMQMREQDRKDRETGIKEKLAQAKIAGDADRIKILEDQLRVNAAEKADKQELAERKQVAAEELGEQNVEVAALKVGVMGRAQDQNILIRDRELALQENQQLRDNNNANELGDSRDEP